MVFKNKFGFLVIVLLAVNQLLASSPDSTANDIFEIERRAIQQRIGFEKARIGADYRNADARIFHLVDSVSEFIVNLDAPRDRRNLYLKRLQIFLQNIDRYYSESYLKSGTYLAVLSYFPVMIQWDQKDELSRNIKRYAPFSIKATRLIPSDTIAEEFLTDYLTDHPDDVFRYAEEFDDRKFARRLLEKAVRLAPESAKRYFTTANPVNFTLEGSSDLYVRKSYEIYNRFGIKSRAYLLLDAIVNNNLALQTADSLGNHPDQMFSLLVDLSLKYEANVTYSIYRYMDIYCIDAMRKINQQSFEPTFKFESFNQRSPEEMFVLLAYGYKETTPRNIQLMMEILRKKSTGFPISSVMINSMDKNKLKEFIIYCDRNKLLMELLSMVDDSKKDYLLALSTFEERENPFPPFKNFMPDYPITNNEPEDRTLNEISRVNATQPISEDVAEIPTLEKPEKTVEKIKPVEKNKTEISIPPPSIPEETAKPEAVVAVPELLVEPLSVTLDDKTRTFVLLKKNIFQTVQNINSFIEQEYAEEILEYVSQKEPDELFKKIDAYKDKRYSKKILELCSSNAPVSLKRYLYNPRHPVNYILGYSTDPVVKKIIEINPALGYHSKPLLLLDDIVSGRMDVAQAITISAEPNKLFRAMVKIISRSQYLGKYSIDHEMRDFSLRFIREINDKIATGSTQPFYSVEGFGAAELYFLMIYGRDEVFTSTFNGLFKRFIQKLPSSDGPAFLKSVSNNRFRDFISLCSSFGIMDEFFSKFSKEEKENTLLAYVSNLEQDADNLTTIVLITEAIHNISDGKQLVLLQTQIKKEYDRVQKENNPIGISIYGVLSSMISSTARAEAKWYKTVSQQVKTTSISSLPTNSLFTNRTCIERMYFYNDDDGRSSFVNFINTYKNQPAWAIDDRYSYVRVYSQQGMQVEIFANKPEYEENGVSAIDAFFKSKNMSPTVIVHRGHSFHTEATLEKVPPSAKLIFVGSCGGFYKISIALENAPDAHIISTKQVGTKTVNEAILLQLNENIRNGNDIIWNDFWDKMRDKMGNNPFFIDYIPPNKNLESIFIRAYYKILGV